MATTFLPFVTTSTRTVKIYTTIIEQASEINLLAVLKVFYAVHKNGLDAVRSEFKRQSELSPQAAYDAVSDAFSIPEMHKLALSYHNIEVMKHIIEIAKSQNEAEEIPELKVLTNKDIAGYYLVMSILGLSEEHSELPFDLLFNKGIWPEAKASLPVSVKFTDAGEKTLRFKSTMELEAFIIYWGCLSPKSLEFTVRGILEEPDNPYEYHWDKPGDEERPDETS